MLDLFAGTFGGNLPQAQFALGALAITSFDLKTRRNLFSHLWHSLALIYVAALFAFGAIFIVFIAAWGVELWMFLTSTSTANRQVFAWSRPFARTRWTVLWLALGLIIFLAIPRLPGRPWAIPLLISVPISASANSSGLPAALPLVGTTSSNFTTGQINLRVPPELGNEVVMHVRAVAPSYWRAYSLDLYSGQGWSAYAEEKHAIQGVTVDINYENQPVASGPMLAQTFEIERPLGTQIIGSYPIQEVFFPAPRLTAEEDGALQSPFPLGHGLIYGVVSPVRDLSPEHLRAVEPDFAYAAPEELQLPSIPDRDWQLAQQIVAGKSTEYDKVQALVQHLSHTYRYSLQAPTQSGDAVDNFLFVDRYGFCEQFASALAVMLRMDGIPSRIAIGYATGDHDAFTGSFTVHNSDAHAWVEVLFPEVGWVPFDATPSFPSSPVAQAADSFFGNLSLLSVAAAVPGGSDTILEAVIVVALLFVLYSMTRRQLDRRRLSPAVRSYVYANEWLALGGLPTRMPFQTPREHLAAVKWRSPATGQAMEAIIERVEAAIFREEVAQSTSSRHVAAAAVLHRLGIRR
jgi:transglutaminase-like putative cysteine protease